jgi:ankyrin repeat protein
MGKYTRPKTPAWNEPFAARADVNAKDRNGNTPLKPATTGGHTEIIKALLAAGTERE